MFSLYPIWDIVTTQLAVLSIFMTSSKGKQIVTIFLTVAQIVTPVFALAAIGYLWVQMNIEYDVEFVTRVTMTISTPCLIFSALTHTEIPPQALRDISVAAFLSYGGLLALFAIGLWLRGFDLRTYLGPLVFGNTGNLGLPLALFAFGDEGFGYAVVVFAIMAILSFSIGVWIVAGGGSPLKIIKEPLVGATLLGGVFLVFDWSVPPVVDNTVSLLGQMAIPLMLITLGVALARLTPSDTWEAIKLSVIKAAVTFVLPLWVGLYFDLPAIALAVLVIQVATPVPVTSYLLARKYEANSDKVAGLVVVSTLLSVAYLPLMLAYFL